VVVDTRNAVEDAIELSKADARATWKKAIAANPSTVERWEAIFRSSKKCGNNRSTTYYVQRT